LLNTLLKQQNQKVFSMDHKKTGEYWDGNAENWTKLVRLGYDKTRVYLTLPKFLEMLPEIHGMEGLDIGCGEGSNTREFQKLGAKMTAIDISTTFIKLAQELEEKEELGIKYQVASAVELPFEDNSFDFTVSTMAMMDIPEFQKVINEAFRVTKPGGFFQFSMTHPCFNFGLPKFIKDENGRKKAIILSGYFDEKNDWIDEWIFGAAPKELTENMERFKVPRFEYTLSQWLNVFAESRFILEKVCEPNPSDELLEREPSFWTERIVALFIIFRYRKP